MSGDVTPWRSGGTRGSAEVPGVRSLAPSSGPERGSRVGGPTKRSRGEVRSGTESTRTGRKVLGWKGKHSDLAAGPERRYGEGVRRKRSGAA
jgi:hypothetical protein